MISIGCVKGTKVENTELFQGKPGSGEPLASRMRPETLDDFMGQGHIVGQGKLLRIAIESDKLSSLIFFGPPGCGKTALANVIAKKTGSNFISINAVTSGVAEIRDAIKQAKHEKSLGRRTILFIDEIHRFNKSQQDALLADVEKGTVILIGTTIENPYFAVNQALISRSQVFEFKALSFDEVKNIILRALADKEKGLGNANVKITEDAINYLIKASDGDARQALNFLEMAIVTFGQGADKKNLELEEIKNLIHKKVSYDKKGSVHFDTISAFIKSMRGSDPDAALYWLAKMLYGGEDPRFIARRIVICSSEDVGNADPQALVVSSAAFQAVSSVGMPEARIILAQAVVYVATAPKSNASYVAISKALEDVEKEQTMEVPEYLKVASYKGAEKLGRGGYEYPFDADVQAKIKEGKFKQDYISENRKYYIPSENGFESEIKKRLEKK